MVRVENQLMGAYEGQSLTLECNSEAYPVPITYWIKSTNETITNGEQIFKFPFSAHNLILANNQLGKSNKYTYMENIDPCRMYQGSGICIDDSIRIYLSKKRYEVNYIFLLLFTHRVLRLRIRSSSWQIKQFHNSSPNYAR